MALFLCFLYFLISSVTACDRCVHQTKVTYFSKASSLSSGACGYGSLALGFNGGHVAAGVPSLYKEGAGCGACFQIRCKNTSLCSTAGTRVIVTDLNQNNKTDFVISSRALTAMARQDMGQEMLKLGIVDVEYKRVPCVYKNQNLDVRVEESSKKPNYLAIKFLYQGGQTEIVAVDVAQVHQITGETVGKVRPVADMHQRKAEMARHSDCFVALPGGYGTLEELLEVITWAQLGIHEKPVGLLNVEGYYNNLLTFIDKAVDDGFIKPSQRNIIVSAPNAKELVQKLEEYVPVHDGVVAKARWEVEIEQHKQQQQVGFNGTTLQTEIAL